MTRLTAHTVRDNLLSYGSSPGHPDEELLKASGLPPAPAFSGSVNPLWQPPYRRLHRAPVELAQRGAVSSLVRSVRTLTV